MAEKPITKYRRNMTLVLLAHAGPFSGPGAGALKSTVCPDTPGGQAPGELDIMRLVC